MKRQTGNKYYYKLSLFIETLRGHNLTQRQLSKAFAKLCRYWQAGKINESELSELCDRVVVYYKDIVRYY